MLDKIDRKLLLLQSDCTLSLQALADAVNLTTTPCWKRLKKLEDDGILLGRGAAGSRKLGLGLTAFVLIKRSITAANGTAASSRRFPTCPRCSASGAWRGIRLSDARSGGRHEALR